MNRIIFRSATSLFALKKTILHHDALTSTVIMSVHTLIIMISFKPNKILRASRSPRASMASRAFRASRASRFSCASRAFEACIASKIF